MVHLREHPIPCLVHDMTHGNESHVILVLLPFHVVQVELGFQVPKLETCVVFTHFPL